jgi:hypothetical protein
MRKILIAAAVATLGTVALPMAPASAQGWYGGRYDQRNVQRELRECRRELRRADNRREYRRELRECRREIAQARRGNRWGYYGDRGRNWRGYDNDRYWDGRRWRYRRY